MPPRKKRQQDAGAAEDAPAAKAPAAKKAAKGGAGGAAGGAAAPDSEPEPARQEEPEEEPISMEYYLGKLEAESEFSEADWTAKTAGKPGPIHLLLRWPSGAGSTTANFVKASEVLLKAGSGLSRVTFLKIHAPLDAGAGAQALIDIIKTAKPAKLEFFSAKPLSLAVMEAPEGLTSLSLNMVEDESVPVVAKCVEKNAKTLTHLSMGYWNVGNAGAQTILSKTQVLEDFSLFVAHFSDVEPVVQLLGKNRIRRLMLVGNEINHEGAKAIAAAVAKNTSLKEILLSNNKIGKTGADAVVAALKARADAGTGLEKAQLHFLGISKAQETKIRDALPPALKGVVSV